jgi:hypothetical protein
MEIVRYDRGRLWGATAMGAFITFSGLLLFLYPQLTSRMLLGHLIFGSGLGHYVLAPLLLGACILHLGGTIRLALGNSIAIRTDGRDLVVHTLFRTARLPIPYLAPVGPKQSRYGSNFVYTLIFRAATGGASGATTLRLPLTLTEARADDLAFCWLPSTSFVPAAVARRAGIGKMRCPCLLRP